MTAIGPLLMHTIIAWQEGSFQNTPGEQPTVIRRQRFVLAGLNNERLLGLLSDICMALNPHLAKLEVRVLSTFSLDREMGEGEQVFIMCQKTEGKREESAK